MAKLNWEIIGHNIREAREQLETIEKRVADGDSPYEEEFQSMLEHTLHHLAFAWNIRRVSTKKYSKLSDADFNEWSKFPSELEPFNLSSENK